MASKKKNGVGFLVSAGFLFIVTAVLLFLFVQPFFSSKNALPVLGGAGHTVGQFSFVNQEGKTITNKDVEGKIRVAEYFFTSCKSFCPIMNNNLKAVYNAIGNRTDVVILSHTVDPDVDSVAVLHNYAAKMGNPLPGKWMFLTGSKLALYTMAENDYLLSAGNVAADNIEDEFIHTQLVVLVDKQNQVRGFYDATKKEQVSKLIKDIDNL